jgi:ring-1,2-phenylacetyl-CoA epoxidase subunit PaaC
MQIKEPFILYLLHLADNSLILSQRNSAWCGHGPVLEQDIAITNISLDLLGQSRSFYQYAAALIGDDTTEDSLAYLRPEREFLNCLLVEQPNGDWAQTVLRQFFFSNYQFLLYSQLEHSTDEQLAAIAAKSLKEVTYHMRWSSEWVIRLGDGTEESHARLQTALKELWNFTGELFKPADYEISIAADGRGVGLTKYYDRWLLKTEEIFDEARLTVPAVGWMQSGGKEGKHSEYLGFLLAELQYLQRTYPGATW